MRAKPDIAAEVSALGDFSREDLVGSWRRIYGAPPPKGVRRELMIRAVAWDLQAKRLGGLSIGTRRLLRSAIARVESGMSARGSQANADIEAQVNTTDAGQHSVDERAAADAASPSRQRRCLAPGARLIREWNGRTHVVDVVEGGYVFETKIYPSLTAIAGKITGVHWSGPRFFGL